MYKKLLWIMMFVFALTCNQLVFAESACPDSLSKMVQSLKLDDAQKAKIKPILDQLKSTLQTAGSQMDSLENQLSQQMSSATMDQDTVNGLVDQKTKLIGDSMKAKIMAKSQIAAILTPEQKEAFQKLMKKAHEKMAALFKNCEKE